MRTFENLIFLLMKTIVGVFMGGYSSEWEISMQSGETVLDHLNKAVFECYKVIINREGWQVDLGDRKIALNKSDLTFQLSGRTIRFDVIYNAIHGHPGEDGYMQAIFELNNLPHSSSDFFESALTFNKLRTNELLKHQGVPVAKSKTVTNIDAVKPEKLAEDIGLPMFIKPNRSGSSFGITRVTTIDQIPEALVNARKEDDQIIVEQEIKGIEVGCGVVSRDGKIEAIAVTEIRPKNEFFDYNAKYMGDADEMTPAEIDQKIYDEICRLSERIYEHLNLWGIVRIDYIIEDGTPFLIEVNSVPGLSPASIVPQQVEYRNWALGEFFGGLLNESIKRHSAK